MIIDVHTHIGWLDRAPEYHITADDVIRNMERWGIDRSCVLPLADSPEGGYRFSTTEQVLAACERHPGRLVPFCLVDPRFGGNSPDMDFSDLLGEYRERGCVGIGEMVANLWINDPRAVNLYRQAGKFSLPILFDMTSRVGEHYGVVDEPGLPRLEKVLLETPETVFIGHGPTFWAEISPNSANEDRAGYPKGPIPRDGAVARLMEKYPNLWADTSATSGYNALTRDASYGVEFLDRFQDKLLFGTDVCVGVAGEREMRILTYLAKIREEGRLSEEAYGKIMHANAEKLLGLAGTR
ncbi:MAG: amidohydrolase family protein [Planctomycetota bacterium]